MDTKELESLLKYLKEHSPDREEFDSGRDDRRLELGVTSMNTSYLNGWFYEHFTKRLESFGVFANPCHCGKGNHGK